MYDSEQDAIWHKRKRTRKLPPLGEYSESTAKSRLQSKIAFRAALLDRIHVTCQYASTTTLMQIAKTLEETAK